MGVGGLIFWGEGGGEEALLQPPFTPPGSGMPCTHYAATHMSAGARASVYCATSPELESPRLAGVYYIESNCTAGKPSKSACNAELAGWLWAWSAKEVGLPADADLAAAK
jgi:hypothetical protein